LGKEFFVEPAGQPPDLDAGALLLRQEAPVAELAAAGLIQIFGDDGGAGNGRLAFLHQHRRRTGRVEREKFLPPLPYRLLHQARRQPVLAQRQSGEPRVRTERMMEQGEHAWANYRSASNLCKLSPFRLPLCMLWATSARAGELRSARAPAELPCLTICSRPSCSASSRD